MAVRVSFQWHRSNNGSLWLSFVLGTESLLGDCLPSPPSWGRSSIPPASRLAPYHREPLPPLCFGMPYRPSWVSETSGTPSQAGALLSLSMSDTVVLPITGYFRYPTTIQKHTDGYGRDPYGMEEISNVCVTCSKVSVSGLHTCMLICTRNTPQNS